MKKAPKILIVTVASWNSRVGANTWATLVDGYPAENLANICIREEYPDSDVCSRYFVISENRVLRSVFNRKIKTGYEVDKTQHEAQSNLDLQKHAERYQKMGSKRKTSMLLARELVWKLGKWKTSELDRFLDDFKPDIILHSMEGYIHLNRIIDYAVTRTQAKAVGYIWDDNFTYLQSDALGHQVYRLFQRKSLKKLAKKTSAFFAITPKTKKEADSFFNIDSVLLTKPLLSVPQCGQASINQPIRMLYTGKLIIGREDTICKISEAIRDVNTGSAPKILLDIYTNTYLDENLKAQICNPWCQIHAAVPQSEVYALQKQADVLLFAEALDGPKAKIARLSFSTKITDYLSAGKCIFAVGNRDTAPMEYFSETNAAITAYDAASIKAEVERMSKHPDMIQRTAERCAEVAVKMHDPEMIRNRFWCTVRHVLDAENRGGRNTVQELQHKTW